MSKLTIQLIINLQKQTIMSSQTIFLSPHQTIGSEENQRLADFGVIKYYGWKKVTIFQLDVDSYELVRLSPWKRYLFTVMHYQLILSPISPILIAETMQTCDCPNLACDHVTTA